LKPLSDFNPHGSKPGYLAPSCRSCQAAGHAAWRLANPEKVKAGQDDHYERNRPARIAKVKAWTETFPAKRGEIASRHAYKRRAQIASNSPVSDGTTLAYIIARDGLRCHICGEQTDQDLPKHHPKRTVRDHYMPVRLGGTHTADNLKVACWQCNAWKSGRHPDKALALITKRLEAERAAGQTCGGKASEVSREPPPAAVSRKPNSSR